MRRILGMFLLALALPADPAAAGGRARGTGNSEQAATGIGRGGNEGVAPGQDQEAREGATRARDVAPGRQGDGFAAFTARFPDGSTVRGQ